MKSYPYFPARELVCKCGNCDGGQMNDLFMNKLVGMRFLADFPFPLSSAFRCPAHNDVVSSSGLDGPHTTGRTVDIRVYGPRALRVLELAAMAGMTGIGVQQNGPHSSRFIHLDDLLDGETSGPRPWVWTY